MKPKKSIVSILRSNEFAIWVAILSVIVQSFHSFTAFYNTSSLQNGWGIAQAVLFSIVIDLAILFYTVRNRKDIALYAAVVMVVINAYYYYQHLDLSFAFIFGCFLSLIIPVSVYFYSEEIREEENKGTQALDNLINLNDQLSEERDIEHEKRLELQHELDKANAEAMKTAGELLKLREAYKATQTHLKKLNVNLPDDVSLLGVEKEAPINIPRTDRP